MKPRPPSSAAVIATGVPNPAAPSMNAPNENATSSAWMRRSADSRADRRFDDVELPRRDGQVVEEDRVDDDPADREEAVGGAVHRRAERGGRRHAVDPDRHGERRDQPGERRPMRLPFEDAERDQQQHDRHRGGERAEPDVMQRVVGLDPLHQATLPRRSDHLSCETRSSTQMMVMDDWIPDDILSRRARPSWPADKDGHMASDRISRRTNWPGSSMPITASTPTPRLPASPRCRSRCTAGRATTSSDSRASASRSAAASRPPGNYPGRARTPDELRADADQGALADPRHAPLQPARLLRRVRRQAGRSRRNRARSTSPAGSTGPRRCGIGLDFNPTFFSHPKAADNFTLAHPDAGDPRVLDPPRHRVPPHRRGHGRGARHARASPTIWIPDGMKDTPVDRVGPRERLVASLDEIFAEPIDPAHNLDALEGKLFGLGIESYTVGSHEFYFGYALSRRAALRARHRPLPPDRDDRRQDQRGAACSCRRSCCTSAAASAGTATTSSC